MTSRAQHGQPSSTNNLPTGYFADRNPIGGRISTDEKDHTQWSTVVGVVADVRHLTLEEAPQPQMYSPGYEFGGAYIAVRSCAAALGSCFGDSANTQEH